MYEKKEILPTVKWKIWVWYSILFMSVGMIIFLPFAIYGKTLLWNSDGYLQYYAVLAKAKQVITDFIQGRGISFWSWDTGLGSDLIGNYALVLCDPFCWLVIFVPYQYLDIAYSIIIILKLYFAGLVMLEFMRYHNKKNDIALISAIGYAFCAWGLISLRHEFFLNQLILFPLLILGVDRVDNKKSPYILIISVMMSIMTSLYFSYISALMVTLYIILKYFVEVNNKTIKDFMLRMGKYIIYALIGGILATPILLPSLYTLLQASTGSGVDKHILPTVKEIIRFIPSFAGMMIVTPSYGIQNMNMLIVLMVPAMFLSLKTRKISKYMFFICVFFAIFPLAQSVLNGFSYSSGRWSYVLSFFFVYSAADVLSYGVNKIYGYVKATKFWLGLILGISLFGTIIVKAISLKEFLIILLNLLFGVVIFYLLLDKQEVKKQGLCKRVFILTLANIALIPVVYNIPNLGNDMSIYMSPKTTYNIYESTALRAAKNVDDSDFYRIDTVDHPNSSGAIVRELHTPANIAIYWQTPSVFTYLSTVDKKWIEFNKLLGNCAGTYRRVCVLSNDNRARLDFLLGVKYFLSSNASQVGYAGYGFTTKKVIDSVDIMQSTYSAGLGYVYDTVMSESDFLQYRPLEREQLLMQCVELSDKDIQQTVVPKVNSEQIKIEVLQVPSTFCDVRGKELIENSFTITPSEKNMTVTPMQEIKDSELYLLFRNLKKEPVTARVAWELSNTKSDTYTRHNFFSNYLSYIPYENFSIYVNTKQKNIKKRLVNSAGEAQGIRGNTDYMVNLGYFDSFNEQIALNFSEIGNYTFDSVELLAVPIKSYQEQAAILSQNRFTVTNKMGNNHIFGKVHSNNGGMLYLSILYNPGWKIYIDGKRVDRIYHVNTAFMGVEVSAGEHEIELVYRPLGYPYTLIIFAIGVGVTIMLELQYRRKKQGENV